MTKVAVVTDSTVNIPPEISKDLPIYIAPLQLIWGSETFRDGVDIQPSAFYERLKTDRVTPSTSQPSPSTFADLYRRLLEQDYQILGVHISSKLSGTLDSAIQARQSFPSAPIELIDSETTSMAMGFQVLAAARAAAQGASLQDCRALVEKARQHTGVCFAVGTLEFLRRGGRIGGAAAFLGTALNLKPILELKSGRIEAIDRVRTMSKAIDRLLDLTLEQIGDRRPVHLAGLHAGTVQEASTLVERARQRFEDGQVKDSLISEVSPVIGTHTGPGVVGLAYMAGI